MSKALIVLLAYFATAVPCGLFAPWLAFSGYIAFVTLAPTWTWRNEIPQLSYQLFLTVSVVVGVLFTRRQIIPRDSIVAKSLIAFSLYVALVGVAYCFSENQAKSFIFLDATSKILVAIVFGLAATISVFELRWLMWTFVVCQSWIAFENNLIYFRNGWFNSNSFYWLSLDNNTFSLMYIPCLGVTLGLLVHSKSMFAKFVAMIALLLQMHQIMLLQSRGAYLGAIVLACIGVAIVPKTKINVLIISVALIVSIALAGPSVMDEFTSIFSESELRDESADSRFKLWRAGAEIMFRYPLLGVGPWMGDVYVPLFYDGNEALERKALHNLFFEVGTGMGVFALILYLFFFWLPWWHHLRRHMVGGFAEADSIIRVANFSIICVVPAYWFASMFSSGALIETPYLMVLFALAALKIHDCREGAVESFDFAPDVENL